MLETPALTEMNRSPLGRRIEVLLVEDSAAQVRLMREAFRDINDSVILHHVSDGGDAMDFLRQQRSYTAAPRPDLILLDLNLVKMHGQEVLACIKSDPDLKMIPTIILTSSDLAADVAYCYERQANCYLRKPTQYEAYQRLVGSINDFWLTQVTLMQRAATTET